MGEMTIGQLVGYIKDLTVTGMFAVFVWGGYKRWWVWGYQLIEANERCLFYQNGYERLLSLQERAVSVTEKKVL
jgi:hypothetical protein